VGYRAPDRRGRCREGQLEGLIRHIYGTLTFSLLKYRINIGQFMEARVGIELCEFVDSMEVVDLIGCFKVARTVRNAKNAALGDVQVTRFFRLDGSRSVRRVLHD
jgi:hypothetical protein